MVPFAVPVSRGEKNATQREEEKYVKLIRLVKVCFKMPQFCTVFYKESLFLQLLQLLYILRDSSPAHSLPVLAQLLAVIDGFDELHGCRELHPPVGLLSRQTAGIETADVLHSGQQARGVCLGGQKRETHSLFAKLNINKTPQGTEQNHNSLCAVILVLQSV